ncbi:MAG: protein kinase [Planctomycetes bacterium]|nr:protein kinase [Planctomycetota bacterium]
MQSDCVMSVEASINRWLAKFKAGDQAAAQHLWERYFRRLVGLARKKIQGLARRAADEEDVALSAFASFCRGVEHGRFPRLDDKDDLWRLLVTITARKAYQLRLREGRQKRSARATVDEAALAGNEDAPGMERFLDAEPTPQMAALIAEEMQQLLAGLHDPELQAIASWKLEGYTNEEIAGKLKCVPRTVERRVADIRQRLDDIRTRWLEMSSVATGDSAAASPPAPDPAPDAWQIVLRVTAGPNKGWSRSFSGHDTLIVGRSKDAKFRLPPNDRYVSRIHFLVELNPPYCRLMDMGSRHGTRVNDEKVQRKDLKDGDKIQAGKTVFRITIQQAGPIAAVDPDATLAYSGPALPTPVPPLRKQQSFPVAKPASSLRSPAKASPTQSTCPACDACSTAAAQELCPACAESARQQAQPFAGFRIVRELGRGGMGVVFLALRLADHARVALKQIRPAVAGTRGQVDRFLREAAILKTLDHPHIVAFRDLGRGGEADELIYFAMEFVPGLNGEQALKKDKRLTIARAVGMVRQLLEALAYAHAKGFVHRDIKPANLMIAAGDHVKLADFGLARVYQDSALSGLTLAGDMGGTMAYMPPEQILNYRQAKPPVDQYSAAATLYRLLTGSWVFDLPKSFEDQLPIVLQEQPVPIRERCRDIPKELAVVIHKALAKEPGARFADVRAFRQALRPFASS